VGDGLGEGVAEGVGVGDGLGERVGAGVGDGDACGLIFGLSAMARVGVVAAVAGWTRIGCSRTRSGAGGLRTGLSTSVGEVAPPLWAVRAGEVGASPERWAWAAAGVRASQSNAKAAIGELNRNCH
jgi:hypothetical protein